MRLLFRTVVLASALCATSLAYGQFFRTDVSSLERALRRRNTQQIMKIADEKLAVDPDDPEAQALRGAAFSILGWPTEAVLSFELACGGAFYEQEGQRYHAESLRDLGYGIEAAEMRRERRLVDSLNHHASVGIEANIVDDLRTAGAWEAALDAADDLLATAPQHVIVHATVAELMYDLGEHDEAMFQLFLAQRTRDRSFRYREVLAQIAYDERLYDEAIVEIAKARKQRSRLPRVRALQLLARCDGGEVEQALTELDYPRFRDHGSPELLAAEAHCRVLNGELGRARLLVADLQSLAPDSPHTENAAAVLAAAASGR